MRLITLLVSSLIVFTCFPLVIVDYVHADPFPAYLQSASVGLESVPLAEFSFAEENPQGYGNHYQNFHPHDEKRDQEHNDDHHADTENEDRESQYQEIDNEISDRQDEEDDEHELDGGSRPKREFERYEHTLDNKSLRHPDRVHGRVSSMARLDNLERIRERLQKSLLQKKRLLNRAGPNKRKFVIQRQYQRQRRQLVLLNKVISGAQQGRLSALNALNLFDKDKDSLSKLMNAPEKLPISKFLAMASQTSNKIKARTAQVVRGIDQRIRQGSRIIRKLQLARHIQIRKARDNIRRIQSEIKDRAEIVKARMQKVQGRFQRKLEQVKRALSTATHKNARIFLETKLHTVNAQLSNVRAKIAQRTSQVKASLSRCKGAITSLMSRKMPGLPGMRKLTAQLKKVTTEATQLRRFITGRMTSLQIGKHRYIRDKQGRLRIDRQYKKNGGLNVPSRTTKRARITAKKGNKGFGQRISTKKRKTKKNTKKPRKRITRGRKDYRKPTRTGIYRLSNRTQTRSGKLYGNKPLQQGKGAGKFMRKVQKSGINFRKHGNRVRQLGSAKSRSGNVARNGGQLLGRLPANTNGK